MTHRGPFQPLPLCDSVVLRSVTEDRGKKNPEFADIKIHGAQHSLPSILQVALVIPCQKRVEQGIRMDR